MDLRTDNLLGIREQKLLVCYDSACPHRSHTHIGKYFSYSVDQNSTSENAIFYPPTHTEDLTPYLSVNLSFNDIFPPPGLRSLALLL